MVLHGHGAWWSPARPKRPATVAGQKIGDDGLYSEEKKNSIEEKTFGGLLAIECMYFILFYFVLKVDVSLVQRNYHSNNYSR